MCEFYRKMRPATSALPSAIIIQYQVSAKRKDRKRFVLNMPYGNKVVANGVQHYKMEKINKNLRRTFKIGLLQRI